MRTLHIKAGASGQSELHGCLGFFGTLRLGLGPFRVFGLRVSFFFRAFEIRAKERALDEGLRGCEVLGFGGLGFRVRGLGFRGGCVVFGKGCRVLGFASREVIR